MLHRTFFFGLLCALPFGVLAQPGDDPSPHSEAMLVSEVQAIEPGRPFEVALRMEMDPEWHSYWQNPGDSGMPTSIAWDLPEGFEAGPILWPFPERVELLGLTSYGYSDEVWLLTRLTPPATLDGPVTLAAKAEWLICADVCIPAEQDVALTLPVGDARPDPAWADGFRAARAALPVVLDGWEVRATATGDGYALDLAVPPGAPGTLDGAYFFADEASVVEHPAPQPITTTEEGYRLGLPASSFAAEPAARLSGMLVAPEGTTWDGTHRALAVDVAVAGTDGLSEAGGGTLGLPLALLLAFLGGLLLNLMPCVFPVLSIKVLGFVQGREQERATLRSHGLAFGAGVLVSFWLLAAALLALRAGGAGLGWGFQLQSPWVVGALALLMFGLGLNLVGVFELGLGLMRAGGRLDQGNGLGGAFWSGVLATVVATPCTAPFMASALGYAFTQPATIALAVFTLLGIGMALPVVLLSFFPAWLERLPRPGAWMETLKQALAFPLFLTAVWLVLVFSQQTNPLGTALLLGAMTLIAFGGWLLGRWPAASGRQRLLTRGLAVAAFVLALFAAARGAEQPPLAASALAVAEEGWMAYDADEVERLVAAGKPVFVDFTATWCLTCQVNKVALHDSDVEEALRARGVVPMVADWTNRDPEIAAAIERLGRSGVPLYVLYPSDGREPIVLPTLLTPGILLDALRELPTTVAAGDRPS